MFCLRQESNLKHQILPLIIGKYFCLRPGSNHGNLISHYYLLAMAGIQMVFEGPQIVGLILCECKFRRVSTASVSFSKWPEAKRNVRFTIKGFPRLRPGNNRLVKDSPPPSPPLDSSKTGLSLDTSLDMQLFWLYIEAEDKSTHVQASDWGSGGMVAGKQDKIQGCFQVPDVKASSER